MTAPAGQEPQPADDEAAGELPAEEEIEQYAQRSSRKLLTFVVIGVLLFVLVRFTPLGDRLSNIDELTRMFKGGGMRAEFYFVLLSGFLMMLGVPRLLFCALAGAAFGFWDGMWASLAGSLLGSFVAFWAARWGGRDWLTQRFGQNRFFSRIVHAKPTVASVLLIRMLPVSNVIINVGLALSKVRNTAFLIGSLLGFVPQGAVAVMIGSGVTQNVPWVGAAQLGVAAVLLLGIWWYTSWHKRRKRS